MIQYQLSSTYWLHTCNVESWQNWLSDTDSQNNE